MALRKTPIQLIPQGLETSVGSRNLQPGQMVIAENVRFTKKGEARKRGGWSYTRSSGFSASSQGQPNTSIAMDTKGNPYVRTVFPDSMGTVTGDSIFRRAVTGDYWEYAAPAANAYCEAEISALGNVATSASIVSTTAAEFTNGWRHEYNTTSAGSPVSTVVVSATELYQFRLVPGSGSSILYRRKITYASNGAHTIGAETALVSAVGTSTATPYFDVVYLSTIGEIAVAWRESATTYRVKGLVASTNLLSARDVTTTAESDKVIAFLEQDESGGRFYLALGGSVAGVRVQEHSISTFAVSGTQTMMATATDARQITGCRDEASTVTLVLIEHVSSSRRVVANSRFVGTGAGSGTAGAYVVKNCGLYSRAFKRTQGSISYWYYAAVQDGAVQNSVFVCCAGEVSGSYGGGRVAMVGRTLIDATGGPLATVSSLPRVSAVSATKYTFNSLGRRSFDVSGATFLSDLTSYRIVVDFDMTYWSGPAELGGMHYPGGLVSSAVGEDGPAAYPELISVVGGAGGSMTPSATYTYTAVFRKTSDGGDVHRSAEAFSVPVTLTAGQASTTITFKDFPTQLRVTDAPQMWIDVYRTPAGGDGSAFYKCVSYALYMNVTPSGSFGDTMSDATLILQEKLYTTGDVLENISPPSSRIVIAWKNRLVATQRRGCWISKEYSPGFGVGFNDTITIGFDDPGGDITACAVMDDRLYFHRSGGIWSLTGDGPTDTGEGGYDRPVQVATVSGALTPKLVATTPLGQVYVNNEGVQLLDRGHNVQYLGAPIESLFTPSTATKVFYVPESEEIRVLTSSGSDYVYDMAVQSWTVDTHSPTPFVDAVVLNGAIYGLTAAGGVYQETPSVFQDNQVNNYAMKLKTGKISAAGIAGLAALFEVTATGECMAACTLRITVTTYGAGTTRSEVFNRTLTVGRMNARAQLRHTQCSEFEVQVEEIASSGQAFRLEALTAWVGALPGPDPVRGAGRMTPT